MDLDKRSGESVVEHKIRLYQQSKPNWNEINKVLDKPFHGDSTRKASYGYLECYRDITENTFDKSVMIINDIHLPFEREDVIEIIKKHSHEITHLLIAGDLLDCYAVSSFVKDNHLSITQEIKYGHEWLKKVSKILNGKPIIVCKGNHEERWEKIVLKDPILQNFVDPKILRMYKDGFPLFEGSKKISYEPIENYTYIDKWYIPFDKKIIACHPKNFSTVPASTLEKTIEHFVNKGLDFIPQLVSLAHTHKFSTIQAMRKMGIYGVENGCFCQAQDYADSGNISYTPQAYCYTIVKYNDCEDLDINNVKTYHLK